MADTTVLVSGSPVEEHKETSASSALPLVVSLVVVAVVFFTILLIACYRKKCLAYAKRRRGGIAANDNGTPFIVMMTRWSALTAEEKANDIEVKQPSIATTTTVGTVPPEKWERPTLRTPTPDQLTSEAKHKEGREYIAKYKK